ncbi:MAG: valine--tRNA ligase [Alphaproteobacteria bacterium]
MLDKRFEPSKVESSIYTFWEGSGAFTPDLDGSKPTYTIMMPPPNVTGSLHIGHALNHTLQDIIVRYKRMQGFDVLWQPGTDHAGIATQSVVEKQMDGEGLSRHDLGREKFLERVWDWKAHSGGTIVRQLRCLGVSPDWTRERFTMDEGLNFAVRKVFVQLFKDGLIFRDKRLVNWDPHLQTAISDVEVKNEDRNSHMWHFKYPLEDGSDTITIATTRPETMLGDTAVAVHPEDKRYQHLVGKNIRLPLADRLIPIIADEYSDPEKGTGAVKITPAHDFNDFDVGRRHNLEMINILDSSAKLNDAVPKKYQGMDRFAARKKIVEDMDAADLLVMIEDIQNTVPIGERSGVVVEPWLTDQWFVDAKVLAEPALEAVKSGKTKFIPGNWSKTYYNWLEDIQPWCISRQLWWGHRIPAWYGPDNHIFVAMDEDDAKAQARERYGSDMELRQDEDVLDTWFSSALWPFSTLGWPEETKELNACYPGDLLITGHDIIFFWVARMMMMGLYFKQDIPFSDVYITALVRDSKGQKMSKSKGNVIDPLDFLEDYGADALRFSLSALAGPGRSVNFSKEQVEGYRNFTTKIWNAFRFCEHNGASYNPDFNPDSCQNPINQWMVSGVYALGKKVAQHLADYRYDEASLALYHFVWGTFCDWYVELIKPILQSEDAGERDETRQAAMWGLVQILHLLHPFMPFITEELWQHVTEGKAGLLMTARWPAYATIDADIAVDEKALEEVEWAIQLISEIRTTRSELNIPAGSKLNMFIAEMPDAFQSYLQDLQPIIERMARLAEIHPAPSEIPDGTVQIVVSETSVMLDVGGSINIEEERKRLESSLADVNSELIKLDKKLSQQDFLDKAPADIIAKNKARREEAAAAVQKLESALRQISGA